MEASSGLFMPLPMRTLTDLPVKARVLIFKQRNGTISCKVKLLEKQGYNYRYRQGNMKRYIRPNEGIDTAAYPLLVGFDVLDEFLDVNGVKDEYVEVDPASLDIFYGFWVNSDRRRFSAELTPTFVNNWWNRDCPDLIRFSTNKDRRTNGLGICWTIFQNQLVDASMGGVSIDEDITENEVAALSAGREQSHIVKEMKNVLETRKLTPEQIAYMEGWVADYEQRIQTVINLRQSDILNHIADCFEDGHEKCYGFDCGFFNVLSPDPTYKKFKNMLKNLHIPNKHYFDSMSIRMPHESQSLTIMKKEFEMVRQVVQNGTGERLGYSAMLD